MSATAMRFVLNQLRYAACLPTNASVTAIRLSPNESPQCPPKLRYFQSMARRERLKLGLQLREVAKAVTRIKPASARRMTRQVCGFGARTPVPEPKRSRVPPKKRRQWVAPVQRLRGTQVPTFPGSEPRRKSLRMGIRAIVRLASGAIAAVARATAYRARG